MKKLLSAAFLVSLIGTGAELLLLEHTEGVWQLLPLILIGLGLLMMLWLKLANAQTSKQIFRGLMLLFIISGAIGFSMHYNGNMAFELEMYPTMKGRELMWETFKGATPVLAPGAMIVSGLLGWAYTQA